MRFNMWGKVTRVINNSDDPQLGGTPASLLSLITPVSQTTHFCPIYLNILSAGSVFTVRSGDNKRVQMSMEQKRHIADGSVSVLANVSVR